MLSLSPSTMRWIHRLCLLLCTTFIQVYVCSSLAANSTTSCEPTQFSCHSGRCISIAWACDGEDDCNDNSDEIGCPSTTCADKFFRCDDGKCIPERWICDDSSECRDDSDENKDFCRSIPCDGYRCDSSNKCLPHWWWCDGKVDCPLGDDEKGCNIVCNITTQFKCNNSNCIDLNWKCDGNFDCTDQSDEDGCPKNECAVGEKMCSNSVCVNDLWWCDGEADCHDKSDEMNCTSNMTSSGQICGINEFQCHQQLADTKCIFIGFKCDGDNDCPDGSDERGCENRSCRPDEKMCGNTCLKLVYFCDGEEDCDNGEDEKNCTNTENHCDAGEFDCGSKCISSQLVCNRADDCGNGLDESPARHCPASESNNTCLVNNGGCQHRCIPDTSEKNGRKCECHIGFEMMEDSDTECEDINECEISGTCSQVCTNTKGSYKCECTPGYTLINHRYCKATEGNHAELILSDRHNIRRIHLDTFNYSPLLQQTVGGASALDFNIRNKTVFWTDTHNEKVMLATLNTNISKVIVENDCAPNGLAVDWIHGNLYISHTSLGRIEVARLDGSNRKTLIADVVHKPGALVVDPSSGWMYWTDFGDKPKIEKCGMNGQYRTAIVTENISWPTGLTIDYVQKRLYWLDTKQHTIGSTDLDGSNFRLVLKSHRMLGHPYAVTVFEDYLYWTDWMTNAVHKFGKFGKESNISTIAMDLKMPMDVHVYHINRQPDSEDLCKGNNGGCSHLCLPVPKAGSSKLKSECACPNNMILDGQFDCIQSTGVTTEVQVVEASTPGSPQSTKTAAAVPKEVDTDQPEGEAPTTQSPSVETSASNNKTLALGERDDEGAGYIAGVVIAALLITGVAVCVLAYLLLKRHRSKNIKSMNFDNPVYRKTTTEDHLIMEKSGSRSNLPQSLQPLNQDNDIV